MDQVHVVRTCMSVLQVHVVLHCCGISLLDWNTCSDEDAVPQLRQVSCAALACLLKHTGLFAYAVNCRYTYMYNCTYSVDYVYNVAKSCISPN